MFPPPTVPSKPRAALRRARPGSREAGIRRIRPDPRKNTGFSGRHYIDMNAFFSSVEQQLDPRLRGRPVAVTALSSDSGCCVTASNEARAVGVRTGTRVADARRLCPGIVFVPSHHRLYVRYNRRVAGTVDRVAELVSVRSVDEFLVGLGGGTSELGAALDLARRIKAAIREDVGSEIRCSIGIGPNHLLAKIAGKLRKPDGLQWLAPENMPDRIAHLALTDLPGISDGIGRRLERAGVRSVTGLYGLDSQHARRIWRSVEGDRFVRTLHGMDLPPQRTARSEYGASKVLAPEYRGPVEARFVGRWLVEKAAFRLRRDGWCARRLSVFLRFTDRRTWSRSVTCAATQDTRLFLVMLGGLWLADAGPVLSLGVRLEDILALSERTGDLFLLCGPGQRGRGERLADAVDRLNLRYGAGTVVWGDRREHPGFMDRG